jgi:hypothetical protein
MNCIISPIGSYNLLFCPTLKIFFWFADKYNAGKVCLNEITLIISDEFY